MTLRLLLDACCSGRLAKLLAGDADVLSVMSVDPELGDAAVAALARSTGRVLVTHDKGFGERALLGELPDGAVLIRMAEAVTRSEAADARVAAVVAERGGQLARTLTMITAERVRSRPLDDDLPDRRCRTAQPR